MFSAPLYAVIECLENDIVNYHCCVERFHFSFRIGLLIGVLIPRAFTVAMKTIGLAFIFIGRSRRQISVPPVRVLTPYTNIDW